MNLNDYQTKALSFRLPSADHVYAVLGLCGEVGELHSLLAKAIRDTDGHTDRETLKKELGDILWFVSAIADDFGFGLEEVAQSNIAKLSSRQKRNKIKGSGDDR